MDILKELKAHAEQVEVIDLENETTTVEYESNRLKTSTVDETRGTAVRVVRKGRLGFSASSDPKAWTKLAANAFLAQRISSINSISALCEISDADISEISYAVGSDTRIGSKFLNASIGFGGSCFKKDILNLVYIARSYGLSEVADYWEMVVKINEYQQERLVKNIIAVMFNSIVDKKIALFGFAFKANTGDTRESPGVYVAKKLLEERAVLSITDPKALENARLDLAGMESRVSYDDDPYQAAFGASAIVIVTEWDKFKRLNYRSIYQNMRKPAFIFDGRNILNHQELFDIGFNVYPLGKPCLTQLD